MPLNNNLWFRPESLFRLTNVTTWTRGMALFRDQRSVLSLDIERIDSHWLLLGEVMGSSSLAYELEIEMSISPAGEVLTWDSDCDCPVRSQCKHGVALMIEAAHKGRGLSDDASLFAPQPAPAQIEAERKAAQARMDEVARVQAENQLLRWLQDMDRANGVTAGVTTPGTPPGYLINSYVGKPQTEQYLYLLSVTGSGSAKPQLQIDAVVSYLKLNGDWAKPKALRHAPYQGEAAYDQATAADHEVLQLISAMSGTRYHAYSSNFSGLPQGRAGLIALEQASSTGRLYARACTVLKPMKRLMNKCRQVWHGSFHKT